MGRARPRDCTSFPRIYRCVHLLNIKEIFHKIIQPVTVTASCNSGAGRLPASEQRSSRRRGAGDPIFGLCFRLHSPFGRKNNKGSQTEQQVRESMFTKHVNRRKESLHKKSGWWGLAGFPGAGLGPSLGLGQELGCAHFVPIHRAGPSSQAPAGHGNKDGNVGGRGSCRHLC